MDKSINLQNIISWLLAVLLFVLGLVNLVFVHPVPGMMYLLFSFVFSPIMSNILTNRARIIIPFFLKIVLFIAIMMFTLGVSDLGDMIDDAL